MNQLEFLSLVQVYSICLNLLCRVQPILVCFEWPNQYIGVYKCFLKHLRYHPVVQSTRVYKRFEFTFFIGMDITSRNSIFRLKSFRWNIFTQFFSSLCPDFLIFITNTMYTNRLRFTSVNRTFYLKKIVFSTSQPKYERSCSNWLAYVYRAPIIFLHIFYT